MVQATERNDKKNEKTVPQPEPLVKFVKTHLKDCLFGVRIKRVMHIASDARILIGANHITISWRVLVVREQMMPKIIKSAIDSKTICKAVL